MGTISVQDIEWEAVCTNCDYTNHYKRMVGESIGSVFDQILLQFLESCPKCKGKDITLMEKSKKAQQSIDNVSK